MKRKKLLALLMVGAMLISMLTACSGGGDGTEDTKKEETGETTDNDSGEGKVYGVSVMTHNNSFFVAEIDGVKSAIGSEDEVMAPDPALDIQTQIDQISDMISAKVDVIFIDAIDSEGIKPALVEAKEAGIPVIAIDTEVADSELVVSTIVSDNVDAGRLASYCMQRG